MSKIVRGRTCLKCGWVYFGVTREYAENEVREFNAFFDRLDDEGKAVYGNTKSSVRTYEQCWCGNPHTNFRDVLPGDCPDGVTISPIIVEDERGCNRLSS